MGKYTIRVIRAYNADPRSKQFSIQKWVSLGLARRVAPELYEENSAVATENKSPVVAAPITPTPISGGVVIKDAHGLDHWFGAFCHHTALIMVESKDLRCNLDDHRWMTNVFVQCFTSDHLYPEACGGYRGFWAAHGINNCTRYFTKWSRYMCGYMGKYRYHHGCTPHHMEQYLLKCELRIHVTSCMRRCKKRAYRRRGSCSSSSSSDSDDEGKKMERALPRLEPISSPTTKEGMPALEPISSSVAGKGMPALEPISSSVAEEGIPKLEPLAEDIPTLRRRLQDQKLAGANVPASLRHRVTTRSVPDLVPIERMDRPTAVPELEPLNAHVAKPKLEPLNAHVVATAIKTTGPAETVSNFMAIVNAYQKRCTDGGALTKGCAVFAPTNMAITTNASKALSEGPTEKLRKFVDQYVCVAAPEMLADSSCKYQMANGSAVHVDSGRGIRDYPGAVKDTFIHPGDGHYMIMTHTNLFID